MAETMTNADNFWLHMDHPTNLMVITGIMEFKKTLDYEDVRVTLENRLCSFDRFKQRIVLPASGVGIASWEFDPYFDIRSHFHRIALPGQGGKKELQRMVSDLMTIPMDRSKPLWSCHLIENYKKGCALFFRLHHCIADGIALVYVLLSATDKKTGAPLFEEKSSKKKKKWLPSLIPHGPFMTNVAGVLDKTQVLGEKLLKECSKVISNPLYVKELAKSTSSLPIDTAAVLGKLAMMPSDPETSIRGPLGVRKCVAWSNPIPLKNIKIVSKAVDATINDVLTSTVAGALRRYLIARGDKVKKIELRAAIPVNIRKMGTEFELGNKFSLVFLALPIYIGDPVLRLKEVKKRMDHLKQSQDAFVAFMVLSALGISSANVAKTASNFFANKASTVMTNVPGPQEPLYFAGNRIENFIGWVPRTGRVGMGISVFSYSGNVVIGLVTDEGLVPDPDNILEHFEEELNHLFNLVKIRKASARLGKCFAFTKRGKQCKNRTVVGSEYCQAHQPAAEI